MNVQNALFDHAQKTGVLTAPDEPDERIIELPRDFLPCVSDYESLRIMADYVDESGNAWLGKLLRWTANEWEWRARYRPLVTDAANKLEVWARWYGGWTRGWTESVDGLLVTLRLDWRLRRRIDALGIYEDRVEFRQFAWWDLHPRQSRADGQSWKKPKPRKGYKLATNIELARKLMQG